MNNQFTCSCWSQWWGYFPADQPLQILAGVSPVQAPTWGCSGGAWCPAWQAQVVLSMRHIIPALAPAPPAAALGKFQGVQALTWIHFPSSLQTDAF